jgi:hypothetical protein
MSTFDNENTGHLVLKTAERSEKRSQFLDSLAINLLTSFSYLGVAAIVSYFLYTRLSAEGQASRKVKRALALKLNRPEVENMDFSEHEARFFSDVIAAHEIDVTFDDIGGIDSQLEEVRDGVVLPIEM